MIWRATVQAQVDIEVSPSAPLRETPSSSTRLTRRRPESYNITANMMAMPAAIITCAAIPNCTRLEGNGSVPRRTNSHNNQHAPAPANAIVKNQLSPVSTGEYRWRRVRRP